MFEYETFNFFYLIPKFQSLLVRTGFHPQGMMTLIYIKIFLFMLNCADFFTAPIPLNLSLQS